MGQETHNTAKELVNSLLNELQKCNPELKEHAERVANQCALFSREINLPARDVNQLYVAGLLHDIGKVFIPKEIVSKKHDLSDPEMAYIKKHTILSEKIMSKYSMMKDILPIIRHHHEAVDGTGYPDGLKGDEIPTNAKILCIINSFDRIITNGLSGNKAGIEEALKEIEKKAGRQFDEALVKGFIKFIRSLKDEPEEKSSSNAQDNLSECVKNEPEEKFKNNLITSVTEEIIKKFKRNDAELPVLPQIIQEVRDIMSSKTGSINELSKAIEKDAVISAKLISVANSVMYRGAEKIHAVKQAIPRIGAKEIYSIIATIANKSLYEAKDPFFKNLMKKLWKHSLASAYYSKALSEKLRESDSEKYYFMGLVHDIGKVLLLKVFSDLYCKDNNIDTDDVLGQIKKVHSSFGSSILRKWGFSDEYARVCLLHTGPQFKEGTDKEILIVNLAGNMAKSSGFGVTTEYGSIDFLKLNSAIALGLEPDAIESIINSTKSSIEESSGIFS